MLEIESKFAIPDSDTYARLLTLTSLGGYALGEHASITLTDHYLDTADGAILRGGFALRLRHHLARDAWVGSLKGLGGAEGGVHTRVEHEVAIAPRALPDRWPPSPARDLAIALSQSQPLRQLFVVHQTRHVRLVGRRDLNAAELSLDEVEYEIGPNRIKTLELEIELKEGGTLDDLRALGDALAGFGLQRESKSKFERGLALLTP